MLSAIVNGLIGNIPYLSAITNRASSTLPIFDLTAKKNLFGVSGARIRPLPSRPADTVTFSAWKLAHAVKKAEYTRPLRNPFAKATALGFLLENDHLFDWTGTEFCLAEDAITSLDDFSQTSLAGRIAQGMALLWMEQNGYSFVDRFSSFSKRAGISINASNVHAGKQVKSPDFVVEKNKAQRALVEAKGGFVRGGSRADLKTPLANALGQLDVWGNQFRPAITKKFAIATFLREVDNGQPESSLMAVVDPEGDEDSDAREFPADSVRRANYAAWLRGMGHITAATRLIRGGADAPIRVRFFVSEILGRDLAFVPGEWLSKYEGGAPQGFDAGRLVDPPFFFPSNFRRTGFQQLVVAMNLETLRSVGRAAIRGGANALLDLPEGFEGDDKTANVDRYSGSYFRDGTFVGAFDVADLLESTRVEFVEF